MRLLLRAFLTMVLCLPALGQARKWTVAVYMCGDNDLAQFANRDLEEMKKVPANDEVAIVVEVDKPYETAKRYRVEPGRLILIEDLGEIDMCDPQEIVNFAQFVKQGYPSDHYYVVMWDHGTGWISGPRRSFGVDWTGNNTVGVSDGELKEAIKSFQQRLDKKIDVVTFDACLMGMVEVAEELAEGVDYLLTSEHWVPLEGMPYEEMLSILTSKPDIEVEEFGKLAINAYVAHYQGQYVNMGLVKLDNLEKLEETVHKLIEEVRVGTPPGFLSEIRQVVQTFSLESSGVPTSRDDYVDLGDYLVRLDERLKSDRSKAAVEAFYEAALYCKYAGDSLAGSKGLSVWYPDEYIPSFKGLVKGYPGLDWSHATGWERYLNWCYAADDVAPTEVTLSATQPGDNNEFRLSWSKSYDLADLTYNVVEFNQAVIRRDESMEDSTRWALNGFTLSAAKARSGSRSLFTGTGNRLSNTAALADTFQASKPVLVSFFCDYDTQELRDSLILQMKDDTSDWRTIRTLYGRSAGWQESRLIVEASGTFQLRFAYRTDSALSQPGAYIDDLSISELTSGRVVCRGYEDTTYRFYNKKSGDYSFLVGAVDQYGNQGDFSKPASVKIAAQATPYSVPNPFGDNCVIILDFPDGVRPALDIFSITGQHIKHFDYDDLRTKEVFWDGRSTTGHQVGSGLYFLLLHDKGYRSLGKIARVQ